jgi:ABC-type Co2+ transport system permease subunit
MYRSSGMIYALWLPIVGLSLVGMRLSPSGSRRKRLLGLLLLGLVMAMLFFLPACGGSSSSGGGGGGGGCTGCTPAGSYTVTITGTDANNLSYATAVTLTVN